MSGRSWKPILVFSLKFRSRSLLHAVLKCFCCCFPRLHLAPYISSSKEIHDAGAHTHFAFELCTFWAPNGHVLCIILKGSSTHPKGICPMCITKMCVVTASDRHIFFGQWGEIKKKQTLLVYYLQSRLNLIYCLPLSDHG